VKKLLKGIGWTLAGILVLSILFYLILLAVNWRDQPASPAAKRMAAQLENRPPVADADNAYIYSMGFQAPRGEDPQKLGEDLARWIDAVNRDRSQFSAYTEAPRPSYSLERGTAMSAFRSACIEKRSVECRDAFAAAAAPAFSDADALLLSRYRQLLKRTLYREQIPLDLRLPMNAWGDVIHAQHVYFVQLSREATPGAGASIRKQMHDDIEFWRRVQLESDILITKMISVAAVRNHFFFGNLVLRQLPAPEQAAAIPAAWNRDLSPEELSMLRVMAGELKFSEHALHDWEHIAAWHLDDELDKASVWTRIADALVSPLLKRQDLFNSLAEEYESFATRFQVPLSGYAEAEADIRALPRRQSGFRFYNPIGHVLSASSHTDQFSTYARRVGAVEAVRRAAELTATLRASGVSPESMSGAVQTSGVVNPFDSQAYPWSESERGVLYDGVEDSVARKMTFFY